MVTGVGSSSYDSVGALQGRIQQKQAELNDWTSCVSAKTTKGQAEIQKLSGEISADKERIAQAQQADPSRTSRVDVWA
jgi:hypothetical protein